MNTNSKMRHFGLKKAFDYVGKDPDKNLPKLMALVDKFAGSGPNSFEVQRATFRQIINDPDNNMHKLLWSVWTDIDDRFRKSIDRTRLAGPESSRNGFT